MRCGECGLYECVLRSPMGGCHNGEKEEQAVIFTAPDTRPWVVDPNKLPSKEQCLNDDNAKLEEAISYLTTRGWTCIVPEGVDAVALYYAAKSLVEAVEGYVMPHKGDKYVFRNEVLARCKELKDLLK